MKLIFLNPMSNKGRELIKQFGNEWKVLEHKASVPCLRNEAGFLVSPLAQDAKARWIAQMGDTEFQIVSIHDTEE